MSERLLRRPSASTAALDLQDRARIERMTVRERMIKALELGRRGRAFERAMKQVRLAGSGR